MYVYLINFTWLFICFSKGVGIYVTQEQKSLPNNGIIVAHRISNFLSEFRCLSGSKQSSVGQLIGVNGSDISNDLNDPFFIIKGGSFHPAMLHVQKSYRRFTAEYNGIYTCRIPNEAEVIEEFNVGLYQHSYASECMHATVYGSSII